MAPTNFPRAELLKLYSTAKENEKGKIDRTKKFWAHLGKVLILFHVFQTSTSLQFVLSPSSVGQQTPESLRENVSSILSCQGVKEMITRERLRRFFSSAK